MSEKNYPTKMTKELEAEYIKNKGVICPFCKSSSSLEGQEVDIIEGSAFQKVSCTVCGHKWHDTYQLVGILNTDITDGKGNEIPFEE